MKLKLFSTSLVIIYHLHDLTLAQDVILNTSIIDRKEKSTVNTWLMDPQHHNSILNSQHSGKVLDLAFTSKTLGNELRPPFHVFSDCNLPKFLFLFQNRIAIFKQTWHNATLRSNKEPRLSSSKKTLMTFWKYLVFYNQYANFNQTWDKALSYQFFERKIQGPCKEIWLLHFTFLLLPLLFTHKVLV